MSRIRKTMVAFAATATTVGALTLATPGVAHADWSCDIPDGMTYTSSFFDPDCGLTYGIAYNAMVPNEGMWGCIVPNGWNSLEARTTTTCGPNAGFPGTEYRLTRA